MMALTTLAPSFKQINRSNKTSSSKWKHQRSAGCYEQLIDPTVPHHQTTSPVVSLKHSHQQQRNRGNFHYREIFPSAILPTICCRSDDGNLNNGTSTEEEEEDDVFYYYATNNLAQAAGDTSLRSYLLIEKMGSGTSTHHHHPHHHAAGNNNKSNIGISASHNNIISSKHHHHVRRSSLSSDNGGFLPAHSNPTTGGKHHGGGHHMGVRERLRSSLDKISFKPPFRWGSSDKIQSYSNSTSFSKSKSKKNRHEESRTPQPTTSSSLTLNNHNAAATAKSKQQQKRNVESACSEVERIGGDHVTATGATTTTNKARQPRASSNIPDYNMTDPHHHPHPQQHQSMININNKCDSIDSRHNGTTNLHTFNKQVSRAKGTWNMLRHQQQQQRGRQQQPVKASALVVVDPSTASLSSSAQHEQITNNFVVVPPPPPQPQQQQEPPKLAPVSGKLLHQQHYVETMIVRPTAFKVVPQRVLTTTSSSSPPNHHHNNNEISSAMVQQQQDLNRKSCTSDSNSDSGLLCSGRNSSSSSAPVTGSSTNNNNHATSADHSNVSSNGVDCNNVVDVDHVEVYHRRQQLHDDEDDDEDETEINCSDASPLVLHKFANGESMQIQHHQQDYAEDSKLDEVILDPLLPATTINLKSLNRNRNLNPSSSRDNCASRSTGGDQGLVVEELLARMEELRDEVERGRKQVATLRATTRHTRLMMTSQQHRWQAERDELMTRVKASEEKLLNQQRVMEMERQQYINEKTKVVRYQKQLQENYMNLYKRSRALEQENTILANKLRHHHMTTTQQQQQQHASQQQQQQATLTYPMDI